MSASPAAAPSPARPSVCVVGAGIAGLTLAMELAEHDFQVTLLEAAPRPGGKAGSTRTPEGWVREHVNKNYSAHYYCLPDTLARIPCEGGGTVLDRLVPSERSWCSFPDGDATGLSGRMGMSRSERISEMRRFIGAFARQGLSLRHTLRFLYKHLRLVWMSEARRERDLSRRSYADYLGLEGAPPAMRQLVQLIEITAAANLNGPARAAAEQTFRIFGRVFNPHGFRSMINMLDGPSDERLIEPWIQHIQRQGVRIRCSCPVLEVLRDGPRPGVRLADGEQERYDAVVVATSSLGLRRLLPEIAPPASTDKWANGFYFPLSGPPQGWAEGDLRFCLGSPWSLIEGLRRFDGSWYLWMAASNASAPGVLTGLPYPQCSLEQLRAELLAQSAFPEPGLVLGFYPGQGLELQDGRWVNEAPLYAATLGFPDLDNRTPWSGVYIAGEFTRTTAKVATMEKSNESARRCAAAICASFGRAYPASRYTYDPFPAPRLRQLPGA